MMQNTPLKCDPLKRKTPFPNQFDIPEHSKVIDPQCQLSHCPTTDHRNSTYIRRGSSNTLYQSITIYYRHWLHAPRWLLFGFLYCREMTGLVSLAPYSLNITHASALNKLWKIITCLQRPATSVSHASGEVSTLTVKIILWISYFGSREIWGLVLETID